MDADQFDPTICERLTVPYSFADLRSVRYGIVEVGGGQSARFLDL